MIYEGAGYEPIRSFIDGKYKIKEEVISYFELPARVSETMLPLKYAEKAIVKEFTKEVWNPYLQHGH